MPPPNDMLDLGKVEAYLRSNLPGFGGPITAKKFAIGQSNPTFHLSSPTGDYVLRRKPPGQLLKSAHAVDREYRVQAALAESEVPVAQMRLYCEDPSVIGSEFYIMSLIRGRNFQLPSLDDLPIATRMEVTMEMCRVLAALHTVDLGAAGLEDYGPAGNYLERQTGRWSKQYRATETDPIIAMDKLIDRLQSQMPEDDGQRTLVHGDFRIDNMIFDQSSPSCLALLDWELSTTGHPYADLASVLMQWRMPTGAAGRGLEGIDRKAHGLPTDAEFVARYAELRGVERIDNLGFFIAFCFFRMAAILQGVYRRALDGNASNPEMGLKLGAMIPVFAEKGLDAMEAG